MGGLCVAVATRENAVRLVSTVETEHRAMTFQHTRQGVVASCRKRENGYVVGIRTTPYLIEHFRLPDAYKIGESVEIRYKRFTDQRVEDAYEIVKTTEKD